MWDALWGIFRAVLIIADGVVSTFAIIVVLGEYFDWWNVL